MDAQVTVMDIDEYCDKIEELWPQPGQAPTRAIVDLCQQAVAAHPESSTLWYDLGIILQRCTEDLGHRAEDYLRCFENAVSCNPANREAQQELGYVLDVYYSDYERARQTFRRAIELGADHEGYCGYARVLAQMGKIDEALASLSETACPFHQHLDVQNLRSEILNGNWFWESDGR